MLNVAVAVTMPAPGGNVTVACAEESATEPARPPVVVVEGEPTAGATLTFTVVPRGTLLAATVSVTGTSIALANAMSGETSDAVGFVGADDPLIDVMRSRG